MFLQITTIGDTLAATNSPAAPPQGATVSLLDFIAKGGPLMIPIALLFLGSLYLFFERYFTIRRAGKVDNNFANNIQTMVETGNIAGARALCKNTNTPVARMLDKGLKKLGRPLDEIEKAMDSAGKLEVFNLEKNLSILGTIAGVAPMFGFVGTILGVIRIFYDISQTNDIAINIIADGLYQKMITSAAGLIVGIIAHSGYHYLVLKIDKEVFKLESNAIGFVDLLQEPTHH